MSTGSRLALVALLLALAVPLASGAVGGSFPSVGAQPAQADGAAGPPVANTTMVVELRTNGDARWHVSTTYNLTTANETAAYRELATEFEAGRTSALGLPAFRWAREEASAATGREMEITGVSRSSAPASAVANGTGRLTVSFTWTNFGAAEPGRLTIGDAFNTSEGALWLDGLARNQELLIEPPVGYGVVTAGVAPRGGALVWEGPRTFEPGDLSAVFTGEAGPGTTTGNGTDTPDGGLPTSLLGLAGILLLAVVVAGAYAVSRRESRPDEDGTDEDGTGAAEAADAEAAEPSESETEATADEADDEAAEAGIDEELLSDEERVERLIEDNGGRMKQASIVKETGWSNAKVSQLLSSMEEEGRIDKLRIGRENLISFPDEDVADTEE